MANEPVAWHYPDGKPDQCTTDKAYAEKEPAWTPMYYKHEWVGLTDDEIEHAFKTNSVMVDNGNAYMVAGLRAVNIAQAIEAKLKEKNNG
jgi:hypothetical protein